jgi:hypothetical protein
MMVDLKIVKVKTPHRLETYLWLTGALVCLTDLIESQLLLNPDFNPNCERSRRTNVPAESVLTAS